MTISIRPTVADDIPALRRVLDDTDLFPSEMLPDMLDGFLSGKAEDVWLTCELASEIAGFCYAAPEMLAEGTWNMLAIAVLSSRQSRGAGRALVNHLEDALRVRGQRVLIADTSGLDSFRGTRAFYRKTGYAEEARIRDFWGNGDDKVIFWKSLK